MRGQIVIPVIASILILGTLGFTQQALASTTEVQASVDSFPSSCDPLVIPSVVDELGIAPAFPGDELITARLAGEFPENVCDNGNDQAPEIFPNLILEIVNTTDPPRSFSDVWYQADVPFSFANFDGLMTVNLFTDYSVVKIDTVGINRPLIFESGNIAGVFEPGETWRFVLVDWTPVVQGSIANLCSVGISLSSENDPCSSTGSIIALEVPPECPPGQVGTPPNCRDPNGGSMAVGGDLIPIDSTMVLAAGAQYTAAWMIPVLVSGIGIAIVIARKF